MDKGGRRRREGERNQAFFPLAHTLFPLTLTAVSRYLALQIELSPFPVEIVSQHKSENIFKKECSKFGHFLKYSIITG